MSALLSRRPPRKRAGRVAGTLVAGLVLASLSAGTAHADVGTIARYAGTAGSAGNTGDGGPASAAHLRTPAGMATDAAGNVYVTSSNTVRRIDATSLIITTVAGTGSSGFSGDGGPATAATLNAPNGLAVDSVGDLFISDTNNNRIRRVDAVTGIITTIAGNGLGTYAGDGGPATDASLNLPLGIAVGQDGTLYIADGRNNVIRTVSGGVINTIAGKGAPGSPADCFGDGGPALTSALKGPTGVAVDAAGAVYVIDTNNERVRKIFNGTITAFADGASVIPGGLPDCNHIEFNGTGGITMAPDGGVYFTSPLHALVMHAGPGGGTVDIVAGTGVSGYSGDGGPATAARLGNPVGLATDAAGHLFIADSSNSVVRAVGIGVTPPPSTTPNYAALGDSYQSGVGADDYEPGTDVSNVDTCERSSHAYAQLLSNSGVAPGALHFVACGGAHVADFYRVNNTEPPQLNAVDSGTGLVTVGIGGNDLGFSDILKPCIELHTFTFSCEHTYDTGVMTALATLTTPSTTDNLNALQRAYLDIVRRAAPGARVIAVDYPRLFPQDGGTGLSTFIDTSIVNGFAHFCGGMRTSDQLWMNYKETLLNQAIQDAAASVGVESADMYNASQGIELCAGAPAFFNSVSVSPASDSFHPTVYGHSQMALVLTNAINHPPGGGVNFAILPHQTVTQPLVVAAGTPALSVANSWPGSDVVTTLTSPSGRQFTRTTLAGDLYHEVSATRELYYVTNPEAGTWTVSLFGASVAAGGEADHLQTYVKPPVNIPPVAAITQSVVGRTVTLDAAASNDADGSVAGYLWDFGDGTFATGVHATHTYTTGGSYNVALIVQDNQGALGQTTSTSTISVPPDTMAPVVVGTPDRAPNAAGWYAAPVTITWSATDDYDGVLTPPSPVTVSSQGAQQLVQSGQVCDRAGNCSSGSTSISLDSVAPAVSVIGVSEGSKYVIGAAPTPTCSATDSGSGLNAPCSLTIVGGNSNGVGSFTATASATDVAGNSTTVVVHYKVIYGWQGFSQPINDTAHQVGSTVSVFKAGSTIPAQFTLTNAAGQAVQPLTAPVWITPAQGVATSLPVDESVYSDAPDSGSFYRQAGSQWKYNWKSSSSQSGFYWRIGVRLDDGETYYVNIALR